jgi:hypothetical protein
MTYQDVVEFFGNASKAAEALGCARQTVSQWKVRGSIPFEAQFRIQIKTRGRLKADLSSLDRPEREASAA